MKPPIEMIPVMFGNQVIKYVPKDTRPEDIICAGGGDGWQPRQYVSRGGSMNYGMPYRGVADLPQYDCCGRSYKEQVEHLREENV